MSSAEGEIEVQQLLGRRVRDADGTVIGRIEEIVAEHHDGETVVSEFHLGPAALLERIARFAHALPLLSAIPWPRRYYRIPWQLLDLGDPERPRVRSTRSSLTADVHDI